MGEKGKLFGYNEHELRKSFHSKEMTPVSTQKIEPDKRTLETLSLSSEKLLQEDKEFLKEIYK